MRDLYCSNEFVFHIFYLFDQWIDSIDDSDGEMGDDGERNNKSKRQRIAVSPLKINRSSEGARRKKVPWSTAETLAVLKGYEKYLKI